jgi:hypothetical protein
MGRAELDDVAQARDSAVSECNECDVLSVLRSEKQQEVRTCLMLRRCRKPRSRVGHHGVFERPNTRVSEVSTPVQRLQDCNESIRIRTIEIDDCTVMRLRTVMQGCR